MEDKDNFAIYYVVSFHLFYILFSMSYIFEALILNFYWLKLTPLSSPDVYFLKYGNNL